MTRHEIVALIKKGWENLGYYSGGYGDYFDLPQAHPDYGRLKAATCVCAIGAGARALELEFACQFQQTVDMNDDDWNDITSISDAAFSKGQAIENLEKWADREYVPSFT